MKLDAHVRYPRWIVNTPGGPTLFATFHGALRKDVVQRVVQDLSDLLRMPLQYRMEHRAAKNPTLVHHGRATAAKFHLIGARTRAIADVYVPGGDTARAVAQLFADRLGESVTVLRNIADTRGGSVHTKMAKVRHNARTLAGKRSRRKTRTSGTRARVRTRRRNPLEGRPTWPPLIGETWRTLGGDTQRVLSVQGNRVQLLGASGRHWVQRLDFVATYRRPPGRRNARVDEPWRKTFDEWYASRRRGPHALDLFDAAAIWEQSVTEAITSPTTSHLVPAKVRKVYATFRDPGKPLGNPSRRIAVHQDVANVFGRAVWDRLTLNEATAVLKDVAEMADADDMHDDVRAARELRKRIGGADNLKSYARSLVAGGRHLNPSRSKGARTSRKIKRRAYTSRKRYRSAVALHRARAADPEDRRQSTRSALAKFRHYDRSRRARSVSRVGRRGNPGQSLRAFVTIRRDGVKGYRWKIEHAGRVVATGDPVATIGDAQREIRKAVLALGGILKATTVDSRRVANPRKGGRRSNPRTPRGTAIARATATLRKWQDRGAIAPRLKRVRKPPALGNTAVELGELVSVDYRSDKYTGRPTTYTHEFSRPRPLLVTDADGKAPQIVGGKVKITADGLVN